MHTQTLHTLTLAFAASVGKFTSTLRDFWHPRERTHKPTPTQTHRDILYAGVHAVCGWVVVSVYVFVLAGLWSIIPRLKVQPAQISCDDATTTTTSTKDANALTDTHIRTQVTHTHTQSREFSLCTVFSSMLTLFHTALTRVVWVMRCV